MLYSIYVFAGKIDVSSTFPNYYKSLSRGLYKILENIGASTSERDARIRVMTTSEIMHSISGDFKWKGVDYQTHYVFGSSFEGTTTHGLQSDADIVTVNEHWPVVTNISEAQNYEDCVLLVQDSSTPPGYAKLQRVCYGVLETGKTLPVDSHWTRVDAEDRACLYLPIKLGPDQVRHGPAVSEPMKNNYLASDNVCALRCRSWPACASEWLIRQRHHNWPSQEQIDQCKTLGCFFVSVGHPYSKEKHIQYRISFSLQERLLVTAFNAVQLKCYILLKMIKREKIHKTLGEKSLTSYHFKTCMLYMIENTPAEFWRKKNLLVCLYHCLKEMLECVETGECPNYFIPEENMFEGKISKQMQQKLCDILSRILAADFKFLLHIKSDDLGKKFEEALVSKVFVPRESLKRTWTNLYRLSKQVVDCVLHNRNKIFDSCQNIDFQAFASKLFETKCKLETTSRVTEHSLSETREALSLLLPYVDIIWMSLQIVEAKRKSESNECIFNLLTSEKWHMISLESDKFSSKLKQASLMHMLGYYDLSLDILLGLQDKIQPELLSCCNCKRERSLKPTYVTVYPPLLPLAASNICKGLLQHVIPCVVYLPAERDLTPSALCYEMDRSITSPPGDKEGWYDWAVVDGKVLFHFLLYLNHQQLGRTQSSKADLYRIWWVLETDDNVRHRETGYNILGWIYNEKGLIDKALECFQKSLALKLKYNAAR